MAKKLGIKNVKEIKHFLKFNYFRESWGYTLISVAKIHGFSTNEAFIQSIPNKIKIDGNQVLGIPDEKTKSNVERIDESASYAKDKKYHFFLILIYKTILEKRKKNTMLLVIDQKNHIMLDMLPLKNFLLMRYITGIKNVGF